MKRILLSVGMLCVLLLSVALPAQAAADYSISVEHNADGAPPAYPWVSVTRVNAGSNWTFAADAWLSNRSVYARFTNIKNVSVDSGGWVDDAMTYASYAGSITLKMTSTMSTINFTFNGVPSVAGIRRNGVSIPFTYDGTTKQLKVSVNFSTVSLTIAFTNAISGLVPILVSVIGLVIVVAFLSGVLGLLQGALSKLNVGNRRIGGKR